MLARRSPAHGALASLAARFAVYAVGMAATPEQAPPVEKAVDLLLDMLGSWDAGCRYPNFAERHADAGEFYPAETSGRLRRIKAACDPGELIRSNHPIKPQPGRVTAQAMSRGAGAEIRVTGYTGAERATAARRADTGRHEPRLC